MGKFPQGCFLWLFLISKLHGINGKMFANEGNHDAKEKYEGFYFLQVAVIYCSLLKYENLKLSAQLLILKHFLVN